MPLWKSQPSCLAKSKGMDAWPLHLTSKGSLRFSSHALNTSMPKECIKALPALQATRNWYKWTVRLWQATEVSAPWCPGHYGICLLSFASKARSPTSAQCHEQLVKSKERRKSTSALGQQIVNGLHREFQRISQTTPSKFVGIRGFCNNISLLPVQEMLQFGSNVQRHLLNWFLGRSSRSEGTPEASRKLGHWLQQFSLITRHAKT